MPGRGGGGAAGWLARGTWREGARILIGCCDMDGRRGRQLQGGLKGAIAALRASAGGARSLRGGSEASGGRRPARRSDDDAAAGLGELHGGEPDAAAGAVDEARLAGVGAGRAEERLRRSETRSEA